MPKKGENNEISVVANWRLPFRQWNFAAAWAGKERMERAAVRSDQRLLEPTLMTGGLDMGPCPTWPAPPAPRAQPAPSALCTCSSRATVDRADKNSGKPKDRMPAAARGGQPPPVLTATMGGVSLGGPDAAGTLGSTATGCIGMGVVLASRAYGVISQP